MRFLRDDEVPASSLVANPKNARIHGAHQRKAMVDILSGLGWLERVIVRDVGDGFFEIVNGHMRSDIANDGGDQKVPVTVVDLDEAEANFGVLTFDQVGAMAEIDRGLYGSLVADEDLKGIADGTAYMTPLMEDGAAAAEGDFQMPVKIVKRKFGQAGEQIVLKIDCFKIKLPKEAYLSWLDTMPKEPEKFFQHFGSLIGLKVGAK